MITHMVAAVDESLAMVQRVIVGVPVLTIAVLTGDVRTVLNHAAAVPLTVAEILSGPTD